MELKKINFSQKFMKLIYFAIYGNYEIKFNIIWWRVKQKKNEC